MVRPYTRPKYRVYSQRGDKKMSKKLMIIDDVCEITISNNSVTKLWVTEDSFVELSPETVHKCADFFVKVWDLVKPPEPPEEIIDAE